MDKSRKKASSTLSQSKPKRCVNHGQIQEKGIKYTVTIKSQKVCKPWTNPGKGNQVHSHNQEPKGV